MGITKRMWIVGIGAGLAASVQPVRLAPQTTGLMVGRVVDAASNRPVAQAVVTLAAQSTTAGDAASTPMASAAAPRVYSDSEGRFLFRSVPAGAYGITAAASGYLDGGHGQRRPGGGLQPLVITAGQRVGDLTIRLWKEATMAGKVVDDTGAGVPELSLALLRRTSSGPAGFVHATSTSFVRTDDRGMYRFSGLAPGEYVVAVPSRMTQWPIALASADAQAMQRLRATGLDGISATGAAVRLGDIALQTSAEGTYGGSNRLGSIFPTSMRPDGRVSGYAATFHPSATSIGGATAVVLASGDAKAGVDIQLRPATLTRVSGTLVGPAGPRAGAALHLVPAFASSTTLERTFETAVTVTDANGAFSFVGVPAGDYVLKAWNLTVVLVIGRDPMPAEGTLWAELPISVGDEPVSGIVATLREGLTLSGRVRFEGAAAAPNATTVQTMVSAAFEPVWPLAFTNRLGVRATDTGEFVTQGLPRGTYVPNLPNNFTSNRGWYFESATRAGKDLMLAPLSLDSENVSDIVITFSDRRSDIAGRVLDANGKPDASAAVVVFPADYRAWIQQGISAGATRTAIASSSGDYSLIVRPGDYIVAAIAEQALATWPQLAAIDAVARAGTHVTIARGQSVQLDLRRSGR